MPLEFCEWDPSFKECKEWVTNEWKTVFPGVDEGDELAALMLKLGFEGELDANAQKAQGKKKADDGEPKPELTSAGKPKKKPPPLKSIVVELTTRNKKKHITCIRG